MYDNNNVFAKILRKEINSKVVLDTKTTLVFHDISPAAPIHLIAIPKKKLKSFSDFILNDDKEYLYKFSLDIQNVIEQQGLISSGYRLITNHGDHGQQIINHFHIHILGGKNLGPIIL